MTPSLFRAAPICAAAVLALSSTAHASSHREAPFITTVRRIQLVDATH